LPDVVSSNLTMAPTGIGTDLHRRQYRAREQQPQSAAKERETMTKKEYRQAVKQAQRIFGYVQITAERRQAVRLSKVKALDLIRQVDDDSEIGATWADDDHAFLLVG